MRELHLLTEYVLLIFFLQNARAYRPTGWVASHTLRDVVPYMNVLYNDVILFWEYVASASRL